MEDGELQIKIKPSIRQKWTTTLYNVFQEKKKHSLHLKEETSEAWGEKDMMTYCKNIESHIHETTYEKEYNNGTEIYKYKTKSLFGFELEEKHVYYNLQSYLKEINLIFSILTFIPFTKIPKNFIELFNISDQELSSFSSHSKWLREYIEREKTSKLIYNEKTSEKGIFNCPKCKSFKIEMEEKQTRSADEPMTIFCKCEECETTFIK